MKMEKRHKKAIQSNFISLIETTDLDSMVTVLYERGVFSEQMIEPYKDTNISQRERKRKLYLDITRRGPDAFDNLLEVLKELGNWDLVRELDPNSTLHLRPQQNNNIPSKSKVPEANSFISISDEKHKTKSDLEPAKNSPAAPSSLANENNNEEPIPFVVKKSTKFIEDNENDDMKSYSTRGKRRRVLLLLSYVSFEHGIEDRREGASQDIKHLKHLFAELGFTVLSYIDLTLQQTKTTLSELPSVLRDCECVFVAVSSHGYERAHSSDTDLRCSDGQLLALRDLIAYFSNRSLPHLARVPKVFIFQNCRGTNTDYVWSEEKGERPPVEGVTDGRLIHLPKLEGAADGRPIHLPMLEGAADGRPIHLPMLEGAADGQPIHLPMLEGAADGQPIHLPRLESAADGRPIHLPMLEGAADGQPIHLPMLEGAADGQPIHLPMPEGAADGQPIHLPRLESAADGRPIHLPRLESAGEGRPRALADSHTDGRARARPPAASPPPTRTRQALYSNILIAHSTLPGFTSNRDPQHGSWYIQVLCEVFAAHAHDTHVDELFTKVDRLMAARYQVQTSSVDRWSFNRRLYLHPGLHE